MDTCTSVSAFQLLALVFTFLLAVVWLDMYWVRVPERLHHGDVITVGDVTLEIIALRGHTPGSIAVLYRDPEGSPHLFTGDSLFPGGVGNTFGDESAFEQLITDVEERIFQRLPDETWFYPGHGNDSTLGAERPHLAEWRERGW